MFRCLRRGIQAHNWSLEEPNRPFRQFRVLFCFHLSRFYEFLDFTNKLQQIEPWHAPNVAATTITHHRPQSPQPKKGHNKKKQEQRSHKRPKYELAQGNVDAAGHASPCKFATWRTVRIGICMVLQQKPEWKQSTVSPFHHATVIISPLLPNDTVQNTYESSLSKNKASAPLLHSPSPLSMSHLLLTLSLLKVLPSTAGLAFKHFKFHNSILIFMCSMHSLHSMRPRHFALAAAKGFPRETMITPCKGPHWSSPQGLRTSVTNSTSAWHANHEATMWYMLIQYHLFSSVFSHFPSRFKHF